MSTSDIKHEFTIPNKLHKWKRDRQRPQESRKCVSNRSGKNLVQVTNTVRETPNELHKRRRRTKTIEMEAESRESPGYSQNDCRHTLRERKTNELEGEAIFRNLGGWRLKKDR